MRVALRQSDEAGALLVETAICSLVFLVIIAGILEYGGLFGNTIDTADATRAAVKAGTETAATVPDDERILQAIAHAPGVKRTNIKKVVIYKADQPDGMPPADCITSGNPPAALNCNVYSAADLTSGTSPSAQNWPPSARVPGEDYLGVWIEVENRRDIRFLWSPPQYTDHAVMKIDKVPNMTPAPTQSATAGWATDTPTAPPWNDDWYCWDNSCDGQQVITGGGGTYSGGNGGNA